MWTRMNDIERMFSAMNQLRARMNRFFPEEDRAYEEEFGWNVADGTPRTNLYDEGSHLEIKAEVPGISKEDMSIKIQGNYLEINGTRKSDAPDGYNAHRVERGTTSFTRSFTLPAEIDSEKVGASLKNGILTLTLPKTEAAKPKQITIS